MRSSSIFKSRWMALVWAGGVLWFAYDVAGTSEGAKKSSTEQPTDVTGAPVTSEDSRQLEQAFNAL